MKKPALLATAAATLALLAACPTAPMVPPTGPMSFFITSVGKAWTSSTDGSAVVGHHDLACPTGENWSKSWNFSHQTVGCSQEALIRTGGSGKFYCFAAN